MRAQEHYVQAKKHPRLEALTALVDGTVQQMPDKPKTRSDVSPTPATEPRNNGTPPRQAAQQQPQQPPQQQTGTAPANNSATATHPAITGGTALGHAVWLMMQMPNYRHVFLGDLEWMVLPPILLNQFRLFNADNKVVAFAAWAYLSEDAEKRLQESSPRLAPADWKSGDRLWLIDVFAPFGHAELALKELRETALKGKSFKMHRTQPGGKRVIVDVDHNASVGLSDNRIE